MSLNSTGAGRPIARAICVMLALTLELSSLSQGIMILTGPAPGSAAVLTPDVCHPLQSFDRISVRVTLARSALPTFVFAWISTLAPEFTPQSLDRLAAPPTTPPPQTLA